MRDKLIPECEPSPKIHIDKKETEKDIFQRLFTKEVMKKIVKETNAYGIETISAQSSASEEMVNTEIGTEVSIDELKA